MTDSPCPPAKWPPVDDELAELVGLLTTIEFKPTLERQRDHAAAHGQPARETRYSKLLDGIEGATG